MRHRTFLLSAVVIALIGLSAAPLAFVGFALAPIGLALLLGILAIAASMVVVRSIYPP